MYPPYQCQFRGGCLISAALLSGGYQNLIDEFRGGGHSNLISDFKGGGISFILVGQKLHLLVANSDQSLIINWTKFPKSDRCIQLYVVCGSTAEYGH